MRVKICGITREEGIAICVDAGADALGFVVEYPFPVPWSIGRALAKELVRRVPPYVSSVMVVSGNDVGNVVGLARQINPDVLQLHGEEGEKETKEIARLVRGDGVKVVKSLSVNIGASMNADEVIKKALSFQGCGIDALLLDSKTPEMPAGTGIPLSWDVAERVREALGIPLILAGGLNPSNVSEAIKCVKPYGVDVISGVEDSPGFKNPNKVRAFVKACRGD